MLGTRFGDMLAFGRRVGEFGPVLVVTIFLGAANPTTGRCPDRLPAHRPRLASAHVAAASRHGWSR